MQATIESWRLGWNFTAKETIQSPQNVYTPGVQVFALDPPNVQLQGLDVNDTVKPFNWTEISFLGSKSTMPVPNAQYKASFRRVCAFNMVIWCESLQMQLTLQTDAHGRFTRCCGAGDGSSEPLLCLRTMWHTCHRSTNM